MANTWATIDDLPAVYGGLAAGVRETNRDLARNGLARVEHPVSGNRMYLVSAVRAKTLVFLASENQRVIFWFPVGQPEKDVVLRLDLSFVIAPVWNPRADEARPWDNVLLQTLVPAFLGAGIDFRQREKLAAELEEDDWDKILFLRIGLFRMAVLSADDWTIARAAWMWHGDVRARTVYHRVPGGGPQPMVKFEPEPFFMLMSEVETWVRSGFKKGVWIQASLPSVEDPKPVRRIVATAVQAWRAAVKEAKGVVGGDRTLADLFLPESAIHQFQSDFMLRLTKRGTLAEKKSDDNFRLRLSMKITEEVDVARAAVSVGPADFLISGTLYSRLLELIRMDLPAGRLFRDTGLHTVAREAFRTFLSAEATAVSVVRVDKDNDVDTEIFVFRGSWNGETRTLVVSAKFRVTADGDDFQATLLDIPDSMCVIYSNLPSPHPPDPQALLPRYLLSLINQLGHMKEALL